MLNPLRALTLGGLLLFSTLGHAAPAAPDALRIGYQKGSVSMVLAKSHQLLEQRYPQTHISWIEFPAGPQMLEALNVGSIDIGSTGDIPPIFAQAAGADLVYIGAEPPKPKAEVILVAQGSPIHNVAAAFQQGNVDAWAIWDPYYSAALLQGGARVLTDGTDLKQTGSFYLASRPYAERNGAFIEGVLDTFTQADALTHSQRAQSITLLAKTMGLPEAVIASYLDHRPPTAVTPVSAETAARQQQTADLFYENKLVPQKVDIRARIWQPTATQGAKS